MKRENVDREVFGACVVHVKSGETVSVAWNSVSTSRDSTATAEVNAIRAATKKLSTHNLEDCVLYTTTQPDLMSFTVVLWARIPKIYYGQCEQPASVIRAQKTFSDRSEISIRRNSRKPCISIWTKIVSRNYIKEFLEMIWSPQLLIWNDYSLIRGEKRSS